MNAPEDERKDFEAMIPSVRVNVASMVAKNGGAAAVFVTLLVGLVQWALGHAHTLARK